MENTIQFFTKEQSADVSRFARDLYDESRREAKRAALKSDEGKALLKEINESEYAKELQADRERILTQYDTYISLYTSLKSIVGQDNASSIFSILRRPSEYLTTDAQKWSLNMTRAERLDLNHLYDYAGFNAITNETSREDLDRELGEIISTHICNKAKNRIDFEVTEWNNAIHIDAIVATMEACDESQAINTIVEKIPYETFNAFTITDGTSTNDCGDPIAKTSCDCC